MSNLPDDTPPERLARLARLRWTIELDYRQLSDDGLDHHEGRSYLGFTTTALGDLRARLHTLKPMCPNSAAAGLTLPQALLLSQPLLRC